MIKILTTKRVLCSAFALIFIFCLNYSSQAKEDSTETEKLVSEIKMELNELKQIRKDILSKCPNLKRYKLKRQFSGNFADYFRVNKKYNDYIRTLNNRQRTDFLMYVKLLSKKAAVKMSLNSDLYKMMKLFKKNASPCKDVSKVCHLYEQITKIRLSDSEQQQYEMLKDKFKDSDFFISSYITSTRFLGLCNFYEAVSMISEKPLKLKKMQIKRLMAKLHKTNKNEVNIKKKNQVEAFYKETAPQLWEYRKRAPRYYYRLKLFSACMQSPQKKKIIKKVLQESKLLRKAVVSLIIGSKTSRDVSIFVKEYNQRLNYDNFKAYWAALQEISKNLTKKILPYMNKKRLDKYSEKGKQIAKLNAQCFLECFFTPYLVLDNQ